MKIPYNPLVPLIESHVAIYKIYVLKNPLRSNEIFYVGQTFKSLENRLAGHLAETGANRHKINYIKEITDAGHKPIIESIEVIRGTCFIDKMMVNERELYWIKYYLSIGCKLVNSAGISNNAKCNEYHGYLSCLKRGETSWHYYYCGKTAGGYEVYDVNKLKMDGFAFPDTRKIEKKNDSDFFYDPWQNHLYLRKHGLPFEKDKKITYIKTEIFPVQPQWSEEFFKGIVYSIDDKYTFWDELDERDDPEFGDDELDGDESDYESDDEDNDESDFEDDEAAELH